MLNETEIKKKTIERQVFWLGKGNKTLNCLTGCSFFQLCEFMSFIWGGSLKRRKVSFLASIISSDNAWVIPFVPKSVNLNTEVLVTVCLNGRTKQSSGCKSQKAKLDSFNFPTLKSSLTKLKKSRITAEATPYLAPLASQTNCACTFLGLASGKNNKD